MPRPTRTPVPGAERDHGLAKGDGDREPFDEEWAAGFAEDITRSAFGEAWTDLALALAFEGEE